MSEDDFDEFAELLDDVADLRQVQRSNPKAKALFFRAVARYPLAVVRKAIEAHLIDPVEGKFKVALQPAHVVAQIEGAAANDGRPGPDEAWATALLSTDEAETVVWTSEIAQAMAAAQPVLDVGDKVGARMAFKNAYERLVVEARRDRRPVQWQPSLGLDPLRREHGLHRAAAIGLLPAPTVQALLPPPAHTASPSDAEVARKATQTIIQMLADAAATRERKFGAVAMQEQEELAALKRKARELVDQPPEPLWPQADLRRASS